MMVDETNPAEPAAEAGTEPVAPAPGAERAAELEAANAALKDQLLRALAETENLRKRAQRERADASRYAVSEFAKDMLNVADNLRRALDSTGAPAGQAPEDTLKSLLAGVELTEKELLRVFDKHGIQRIDALDQPFDANRHHAMFQVPGTGKPAGTVVQLMQPGYMLHERLLRPAMVGVARDAAAGEASKVDTTV